MKLDKLLMAGAGVAVGVAMFAVGVNMLDRVMPDAARFFRNAFDA